MSPRITVIACLFSTLAALPANATGIAAHCTRDGIGTRCAWSMTQPVDLVFVDWTSPKSQPVPLCLDCEPPAVALTCTLFDEGDGRDAMVRCTGVVEDITD